jgi:hypothetical protein
VHPGNVLKEIFFTVNQVAQFFYYYTPPKLTMLKLKSVYGLVAVIVIVLLFLCCFSSYRPFRQHEQLLVLCTSQGSKQKVLIRSYIIVVVAKEAFCLQEN